MFATGPLNEIGIGSPDYYPNQGTNFNVADQEKQNDSTDEATPVTQFTSLNPNQPVLNIQIIQQNFNIFYPGENAGGAM